jgi:hypothetical protein
MVPVRVTRSSDRASTAATHDIRPTEKGSASVLARPGSSTPHPLIDHFRLECQSKWIAPDRKRAYENLIKLAEWTELKDAAKVKEDAQDTASRISESSTGSFAEPSY